MELQQSPIYADFISSLGWRVITHDGVAMFYKKIPFMGGLLKIQRPNRLPKIPDLPIRTIAIEPSISQDITYYKSWVKKLEKKYNVIRSDFMPTKTLIINLNPQENDIFSSFSEAKRRAVRKAIKNSIVVTESKNIKELIKIKNKSGGIFGFITTYGIDSLWQKMTTKRTAILLAHYKTQVVGGVLLLFWNKTAFYWVAGATSEGKKYFAPTLLVWESLKLAKNRGMKTFDFVGVWDERLPKAHKEWKGFTRFKEGFGGKSLYYPVY